MLDVEPLIVAESQAISDRDSFDGFDWNDVARRAGIEQHPKPSWMRVALIAAAVFAIAAPAFAFRHQVINFLTASRAPRGVVNDFGRLEASSFPGSAPGILPRQARLVTTIHSGGVTATLAVTPTRQGTYCDLWRLHGDAPITGTGVECLAARHASPLGTFSYSSLTPQLGIDTIFGSVLHNDVSVHVNYKDGTSTEIDYTWVTTPIHAGFFFYTVPINHKTGDARPISLTVSAKGRVLARRPIVNLTDAYKVVTHRDRFGQSIQTSPEAVWEKRRLLEAFNEKNETFVELWVMPSRRGTFRRCFVANPIAGGCMPSVLPGNPLQLRIIPGTSTGTTLLFGEVAANIHRVKLVFSDGRSERVKAHEGYLLTALPARSYARGHRLRAAIGQDAQGHAVFKQPFQTNIRDMYPCAKPKAYGYGVTMCP
jgi:hypothetical protein